MAKKYNDNSPHFKDWTTAKLKREAIAADYTVHVEECYGMSDIKRLYGCLHELAARGIEQTYVLSFTE